MMGSGVRAFCRRKPQTLVRYYTPRGDHSPLLLGVLAVHSALTGALTHLTALATEAAHALLAPLFAVVVDEPTRRGVRKI